MFGQEEMSIGGGMPPTGMPAAPPMGPQGPGAAPPMPPMGGGGILEALAAILGAGGQDGLASLSPPDASDTTGDSLAARLGGIAGGQGGMPGMPGMGEEAGEMDPIMMALLMGGQGGPQGAPPMMPPARPPGMMGAAGAPPPM